MEDDRNTAEATASTVTYSMSPDLAGWLAREGIALAVTSYQSGKLYLLGANPQGGLMVHEKLFQRAMGLAVPRPGTMLMAGAYQIHRFRNVLEPDQRINGLYDACYVPRLSWMVGALDLHDLGELPSGDPVFVNTAWNCLATISERHAFRPLWMPPFVTALAREDRCHLNGMAMGPDGPAFVTSCSRSNTVDGWRDRRADGGVAVDVASGEIVATGLSMPHSPRLHDGQLYLLNSGTGELGRLDLNATPDRAFAPIVFCPGFVRGLALHGNQAIVGLSKPRHKRFEGLALDARLTEADSEPWCGVQVIGLGSGNVEHWFRIDGAIGELYDVAVLPGATCPMALGFGTPQATAESAALVTHEDWQA
ncbi:MAG: TIGR03032 family protein [Pseudomonadota bacterium]